MADCTPSLRCCAVCDSAETRSLFCPLTFLVAVLQRLCSVAVWSFSGYMDIIRTLAASMFWSLDGLEFSWSRDLFSTSRAVAVCVWKEATEETDSVSGRRRDLDYSGLDCPQNPRPFTTKGLQLESVPRGPTKEAPPWPKGTLMRLLVNPTARFILQLPGRVQGALHSHLLRAYCYCCRRCSNAVTALKTARRLSETWRCFPSVLLFLLLVSSLAGVSAAKHKDTVQNWEAGAGGERHLYIVGLFPFTGALGPVGRGVRPAVELALLHVNNDTSVLPGVTLHVSYNDTEVSAWRHCRVHWWYRCGGLSSWWDGGGLVVGWWWVGKLSLRRCDELHQRADTGISCSSLM